MSKKLIATILISSIFVSFLAYNFYQIFYKYQPDVDQILAEISVEDKELPPNVLKILKNTNEVSNIQHFTSTNLRITATEKNGGISMLEWHLFGLVWEKLLAIRIGEKEEFAYFANKVYFGKHGTSDEIIGFKNAAKFYFKKDLQNLDDEEILILLVFSKSPEYVRNINSDNFLAKLNELTEIYHNNLAKSY